MPKAKQIIFLTPYPYDKVGSQRFRFEHFYEDLKTKGYKVNIQSFIDDSFWSVIYTPKNYLPKVFGVLRGFSRRVSILFSLHKAQLIFIHREASPIGPPIFEWLIAKIWRKPIVYDFDDAIWLPNSSEQNQIIAGFKWHKKVVSICKWASAVSCGNEYLRQFALKYNKQTVYMPTVVDTKKRHNKFKKQFGAPIRFGWTGTHSTLSYLKPLVPLLQELEKQYSFELIVICDKPADFKLNGLRNFFWKKETEIEDLLKIDIGLMPLTEDKWANGKCGFKAIQYLALGIPTVASNVGVNHRIVLDKENGLLVDSLQDWKTALIKLLDGSIYPQDFSENARRHIQNNYCANAIRVKFLDLIDAYSK